MLIWNLLFFSSLFIIEDYRDYNIIFYFEEHTYIITQLKGGFLGNLYNVECVQKYLHRQLYTNLKISKTFNI